MENLSYEAFDPDANRPIEGVYVAGWSREASSGLVGVARKDGGAIADLARLDLIEDVAARLAAHAESQVGAQEPPA